MKLIYIYIYRVNLLTPLHWAQDWDNPVEKKKPRRSIPGKSNVKGKN
jgi:hypothetical protein